MVPMRQQWGSAITEITAFVAEPPGVADLLLGDEALQRLEAHFDRAGGKLIYALQGLTIFLDSFSAIKSRMGTKPLSVLATCSGCSLAYCSLRNLGYTVSKWHAVEIDPQCRDVAATIVPPEQLLHLAPHDSTKVLPLIEGSIYDLHISTPPCQPWSRLQDSPMGFGDTRSAPFKADASIFAAVRGSEATFASILIGPRRLLLSSACHVMHSG